MRRAWSVASSLDTAASNDTDYDPADVVSRVCLSLGVRVASPTSIRNGIKPSFDEPIRTKHNIGSGTASPDHRSPAGTAAEDDIALVAAGLRTAVLSSDACRNLARQLTPTSAPDRPSPDHHDHESMRRWVPPNCLNDDLAMIRFVAARHGDVDSAALRFVRFCACVREVGATTHPLSEPQPEALPVIKSGCWRLLEDPDAQGRPVLCVVARHVDWKAFDVQAMKAACLFYLWRLCCREHAQGLGVVACLYLRDMALSQSNGDYNRFAQRLVQQSLPMRVSAVYVADPPFVVRRVLWPVASVLIGKKMRERIHWLSAKPGKVESPVDGDEPNTDATQELVMRPYAELHEVLPAGSIGVECGGTLVLDP